MNWKSTTFYYAAVLLFVFSLSGCFEQEPQVKPEGEKPAPDGKTVEIPIEPEADPKIDPVPAEIPEVKPVFEKHVYYTINMANDSQLVKADKKFKAAKAAGYTHIVLDDTKFQKLEIMDTSYFDNCQKVADMARDLGLKLGIATMHGGNADSTLKQYPNLGEGFKVSNAPFTVKDGKAYPITAAEFKVPFGGFENPEGNNFKGFAIQDMPGVMSFADSTVARSGKTSIRFEDPGVHDKHGRGRLCLEVSGPQHRALLLSFWVKTENFDKAKNLQVSLYENNHEIRAEHMKRVNPIKPTQDWTEIRFLFNMLNYKKYKLYFGVWNGGKGKLWIDDVKIEEPGLLNIIQRTGCGLTVKNADGTVFKAGKDYLSVKDENVGKMLEYHDAPLLTLTPDSSIKEGDNLKLDFMHIWRISPGKSTNICPSSPETYAYYTANTKKLNEVFKPDFWLMYNDEIRVFNRCPFCLSLNKDAGEIMADNIRKCHAILRAETPVIPIYMWSDMVDPHHNMKKRYYAVRGDVTGADKGLQPGMIIYKWAANAKGIKYFSDKGYKQILCGYYDTGDNTAKNAATWYDASRGADNILGVCYTTWNSEYDHMESWIEAIDKLFKP